MSLQRHFLPLLLTLVGTLTGTASLAANPLFEPMSFMLLDPCGGGNASFCEPQLLLRGVIEQDSPKKLREFLRRNEVSTVVFDSPGGNIGAAMEMGRIIRKARLDTLLETEYVHWSKGEETVVATQTRCASACAYAFLGGVDRGVGPGARYGVHQFSGGAESDNVSQRLVVMLISYVESMGASRRLIELASVTNPHDMRHLSEAEMARYGVVTSVGALEPWELQVLENGVPVAVVGRRGVQETRLQLWLASRSRSAFSLFVGVKFEAAYYRKYGPFLPQGLAEAELTVSGRSYPITLGEGGWQATKTGFLGDFEVSADAVEQLRHSTTLVLEFGFPRSMSAYDPGGAYSTTNLEKFVPLLRVNPLAKNR